MHILGCIIFLIIGISIIIIATKIFKCEKKEYEKMDYSQYPVATGTVYHMHDFSGDRWIVGFPDETGKEVLGMDDMISSDTFFLINTIFLNLEQKKKYIIGNIMKNQVMVSIIKKLNIIYIFVMKNYMIYKKSIKNIPF